MMDPTLGTVGAVFNSRRHCEPQGRRHERPCTRPALVNFPQVGECHTLCTPDMEVVMRLYSAICSAIEAWAERTRTETLDAEPEAADWAKAGGWVDDDES